MKLKRSVLAVLMFVMLLGAVAVADGSDPMPYCPKGKVCPPAPLVR